MVMMQGKGGTLILQQNIENVIGACNRGDGGCRGGHFDGCDDDGKNEDNDDDSLFSKVHNNVCKGSNFTGRCTNINKVTKVHIPFNYEKGKNVQS